MSNNFDADSAELNAFFKKYDNSGVDSHPKPVIKKNEIQNDVDKDKEELDAFFKEYDSPDVDLYPNKTEDKYHNIGKCICLGALEKEKELMDKIIESKKKINLEYEIFDKKKEDIDKRIKSITSLIEKGTWNLNIYQNKIKDQKKWEEKLLSFAEKDPTLDAQQKNILKNRLINRIKLIDKELQPQSEYPEL